MEPGPEFSRPVRLDQIPGRERAMEISATVAERQALAKRFGLVGLDRLEATVRLSRSGVFYTVEADWQADVVQACVVTLEPVASHLADHLVERYGPTDGEELELDLDPVADAPEAIEGNAIDIGEAVAQAMSLALDPYPRKPGATVAIAGEEESGVRPFSALSKLRRGS
jgi:hypothetical protein